jgi:hypothetical protein
MSWCSDRGGVGDHALRCVPRRWQAAGSAGVLVVAVALLPDAAGAGDIVPVAGSFMESLGAYNWLRTLNSSATAMAPQQPRWRLWRFLLDFGQTPPAGCF